ncbi:hypothetical protein LRP67_15365 [Nocardioides sp. cx-169]|uniref:hypothetical protein n=1 Tax=Nocardioides sp. cx-169 TaxID=2899080 RepID=UPI001E314FB4|nr:hypothetical protein [Nocardioides sp. cx-169]MCD4535469.1 hypothetical protein [Nocardioides sp. cx-169]
MTSPALRRLLLIAAVLVFLAGLQLYVFPRRTEDWFAWTIEPPMTAVFLGAAYWSSAVLEIAGARAGDWHRARLAVGSVLVFTALTLGVTLLHLDRFHLGAEHPATARAITFGWLAIYTVVPVVLALVGWRAMRRAEPIDRAWRTPLPSPLRVLLLALGLVLVATGVVLLVAPATADTWWSWPLTPLTARAVGAWLVGLGWAAGHAGLVDDTAAVTPVGLTGVTFVVLQCVALARYGGDLEWGPAAAGYGLGLLAIGVAGVWMMALGVTAGGTPAASRRPRAA